VDVVRVGLQFRALRRRRGWTQHRLAIEARVSRSVIYRIERGRADRVAIPTLLRVAVALGATLNIRLLWQGEALDRLLDTEHARLVDQTLRLLDAAGWESATEVSFNVDGERGSVDILAFHAATGILLIIEVKSVVPDLQAMLHGIDRKTRVARRIAHERGWQVTAVARVLVLPDDRTARRRVATHRATFDHALPAGTVAVKRWLLQPAGPIAGVLFLPNARHAGGRHRVGVGRHREHAQRPHP
jgi:transcriptional regulator with XRE-family HTH domain